MKSSITAFSLTLLLAMVAPATTVQAQRTNDDSAVLFTTAGSASEALEITFTLDATPGVDCAVEFDLVVVTPAVPGGTWNTGDTLTHEVGHWAGLHAPSAPPTSATFRYAFAPTGALQRVRGEIKAVRGKIQGIGRCYVLVSAEKFDLRNGESRGVVTTDGSYLGWATFPQW
ncbi:MAG: hypothetical protein ACRED5_22040 [Propylenella sp.]